MWRAWRDTWWVRKAQVNSGQHVLVVKRTWGWWVGGKVRVRGEGVVGAYKGGGGEEAACGVAITPPRQHRYAGSSTTTTQRITCGGASLKVTFDAFEMALEQVRCG
ncbi:hypothetical protein E2C01_064330 [Portunus trituberculatus]|uniref:Uncharacterized protein n=1 Tax=Portunus trituberculatus TaxID=210409 RepID=A0A5B7HFX6_PORTR|nr:hypothetical protein [Portunus trituberculatus]